MADRPNEVRPSWVPPMPIRKMRHLSNLESRLDDDENFSAFTYYLEALGIPTEEEKAVSLIMPNILSNWMASHYSFDGLGERSPFKELKLWKAIEAALYMKYETTLDRVIKDLRSWLRNSKGRSNGKVPPSDDSSSAEDSS